MTSVSVPTVKLNDGTAIPQFGFGVYQVPPEETAATVKAALDAGYRHIDTAQMYGNEEGVGAAIADSGLARDDLYVTTKLNNGFHRPEDAKASLRRSLEALGLDQVDLFLIHWPLPTRYDGDFVSTWQAMIELQQEGLTRSIGVSNFQPHHLEEIIDATGVTPAVNQVEVHPYFTNHAVREFDTEHRIVTEDWSPLGSGNGLLDDPVLASLADKYGKTPAQVVLAWHLAIGSVVIPKSVTPARIAENFDAFDITLDPDDVNAISELDKDERTGPDPDTFNP